MFKRPYFSFFLLVFILIAMLSLTEDAFCLFSTIDNIFVLSSPNGARLVVDGKNLPPGKVYLNKESKLLRVYFPNTKSTKYYPFQKSILRDQVVSIWTEKYKNGLYVCALFKVCPVKLERRYNAKKGRFVVEAFYPESALYKTAAKTSYTSGIIENIYVKPWRDGIMFEFIGKGISKPYLNIYSTSNLIKLTFPQTNIYNDHWQVGIDRNGVVSAWVKETGKSTGFWVSVVSSPGAKLVSYSPGGVRLFVKGKSLVPYTAPLDPLQSNKLVTLDFRDADIRDLFRLLGKWSNLNVVCDPTVEGTITLSLHNVPVKEVFSYLLKMYGLSYYIMGRTIVIADKDKLEKLISKEVTKEYEIAYADVNKLANMLKEIVGVSKIVVDSRLKKLYVTTTLRKQEIVREWIQKLDTPRKQVMLQAKILELNKSGGRTFKSVIEAIYNYWWKLSFTGSVGNIHYDVYPEGNIAIPNIKDKIKSAIETVVNNGWGKILASPSVIALDGEKAIVKLTQKIKYISGRDEAGNPTYAEEEVGPRLEFVPRIGKDGYITLDISVATGEVIEWRTGAQGEEVPVTSERSAKTKVRVRDGEPIVIGGLFREFVSHSEIKMPFLGDIPFLGDFFKTKISKKEKTEVVIVIIPHIIN